MSTFCKLHVLIPSELFSKLIEHNILRDIDGIVIDLLKNHIADLEDRY